MTDETIGHQSDSSEETGPAELIDTVESLLMHEEKDWFLSELIGFANQGLEIPVTLTIGGALVSGRLISGERYFREFSDDLTSNMKDDDISRSLTEIMETFAKDYESAKKDHSDRPMRFIHLAEAKWFYAKGQLPTGQGPIWRGKISSVDGFFLGTLNS